MGGRTDGMLDGLTDGMKQGRTDEWTDAREGQKGRIFDSTNGILWKSIGCESSLHRVGSTKTPNVLVKVSNRPT